MYLYLVRHAEPDYEHDTITEQGHQQAAAVGSWFSDIHVDEIYHSSMGRAAVTASYIAMAQGLSATPVDWAREMNWGRIQGDMRDSMSPWSIKDRIIAADHQYPQGEEWRNVPDLADGILTASYDQHCKDLDGFLAAHGYQREGQLYKAVAPNEKTVVLVCHGGVISALISHLANIPFMQYISHMGSDLTAVTKVCLRGEAGCIEPAHLIYVNSQIHLGLK